MFWFVSVQDTGTEIYNKMEEKSLLQGSERTERSHRRRLSSILKAAHSPLKDGGSGKEPSQEPTIEKRQKRRVSFAETIRVFTPELRSAGSDDKENEGYVISNLGTNIYKGAADKYGIAGMETLLHGPIQVPGHNSNWNNAEHAKDRTMFFSSDNDMDMTACNTQTIHGLTDEGTKKIDTKQFLASLKSQNSRDVVKNQDFSLSTGGKKHLDSKGDSSMENKIKFSDFLASLGGEKSTYDDNQTVLFTSDQQDMEMTRLHTVSIDSNVLSEVSRRQNTSILKEQFCKFNKQSGNHLQNNTNPMSDENYQNVLDITRSYSSAIGNKILEGAKATNAATEFQNTKRKPFLDLTTNAMTSGICFQDDDMDLTKSNSGFYSEEAGRAPCMTLQNKTLLFQHDQDDMDMTYSHTIAVKNTFLHGNSQIRRSVPYVPTTLKCSAADETVFDDHTEFTKSHTMITNELNQLALHNQSINLQNISPATSSDNMGTELKMCREADTDRKVLKQQLHNETVHQEGEMEMTNVNAGLLLANGKSQPWSKGNPGFEALQEKTIYLCDQDDMDMTRPHTVAFEKAIAEVSNRLSERNTILGTASVSKSNLGDVKCTSKPHSFFDVEEKNYTNRTLYDQDMDITMSNTLILDSQKPGNDVLLPGPKYKILSSMGNKSENRDDDLFNIQSRNQLENSPVSGESQDKTLFVYGHNDTDVAKSHKTAIESKLLEGVKAKNVTTEFPNTKSESVLDLTTNAPDLADDLTCRISFQGEDMDITKSNTEFINQILHNKSADVSNRLSKRKSVSSRPKSLIPDDGPTLPVCNMDETNANVDFTVSLENKTSIYKTVCNQGDMEMARSPPTVTIESKLLDGAKAKSVTAEFLDATKKSVLDRTTNAVDMAEDLTSGISFQGEDEDITKSNAADIYQISEKLHGKGFHISDVLLKRKSLSCAKSLVSSDETILLVCNMEETNANVEVTENLVSKSSVDKTVCNKDDMEMTRCLILDGETAKNVTTVFRSTKRKSVLDRMGKAVDMADDLTSGICFQGEDMDITKSNTEVIDKMSYLHNQNASVSLRFSNRKSVSSRPRSLVPGDDTILQVCNMEETHANVYLPEGLENNASFNKTLYNEGDMEMTTSSHTVAIENFCEASYIACPSKTRSRVSLAMASCGQATTCDKMATARPQAASNDESLPLLVSKSTSYKDLRMSIGTNDATMNISIRELSKLQGNHVLAERNKILPPDGDETMLPSESNMNITEAFSATVEANLLDHNPHITSSSIGVIKGDGGELMEMESTERLENCRRKSYARSLSLSVRSGIFLEGLDNGELPQVHTSPLRDVSLKAGPSNAESDLIFDKSNNITVGFIDHQNRHISLRNSISANVDSKLTPNSGIGVDCKMENLEENGVLDDKSVSDEVKSQLIRAKIESLNASNAQVNDSLIRESNLITSEFKDVTPEQPKACVPQEETLQKDPEVALELQLKKAKLKGKRVSFCFPEMTKDEMLEEVLKPASQQEKRDDVEHQDRTVHATEEIKDFGLVNKASVVGLTPETENLEDITLHKERDLSNINVLTDGISSELKGFLNPTKLSEESRNKRRSVANVLLSIKSLTQKPKLLPHTAPVSSLINQLPATSQILCPSSSVTEQVSVSSGSPNQETVQEKEPTERTKTILMKYCLPSRRSDKMFQPKLPNKRASSTSKLDMVASSVSEAQPKNDQSAKVLLKTLHDIDYGQCIGEEMLPDDQEVNGVFDYEVPEGAWEELCKKEALQQNVNVSTSQPRDSMNGQKRVWNTERDSESQREKRGRLNEDDGQTSTAFKSSDKSYVSDSSTPQASKGIERTCNSSSSQDSRGDGMSVELSSQHCSQMDSQLPWTSRCEQSLWQNFHNGTVTVQEFFVLLGIRILIQKPRYSELPSKHGVTAELTASEVLLEQYVYQPKLQVYDEECHTFFQAIEELKVSTERQHKPLVEVNSLLWEALRMCSENELMCFGATLKNMKSLYSKKSKLLAHKAKVSTYSKLLRTAQMQKEQLQARLGAADQLLGELADCISSLHTDPVRLDGECRTDNQPAEVRGCVQAEIDGLKSQHRRSIRENVELEERKQKLLARLGSLQEEARVIGERLQEPSFTEWELVKWTETEAAFNFLYDSLELSVSFGDPIDGERFNNQPCRRISHVTVASQLDDASAPPSTILVHRLISQYVEKKSAFHEAYTTQNDVPQLIFDLSLVVSRCKLLGEELENLTRWGSVYNVVKVHVQSQEVSLLFSSLATLVKFELIIHFSDTYPTAPLSFTLNNRIGSITKNRVTEIMSNVPTGLWYLKRAVKSLHENLLV
ncbi:outer kinetochore KNL1 complex subunit KNL1 isoform X2 [Phyllobates terribilis]|uniref:outer kinetochore KNL1 complex subunit KNL1 isoform X2 n=1 Tax=Phyllobates terribilis TaxID=111132 RepID=UPI003CCB1915